MKTTKIQAWNSDTHDVIEFETRANKVIPYGENGLIIEDSNLQKVFHIINCLRSIMDCEFTVNYSVSFGTFCECKIWSFDGTIDIK